MRFIDIHKDRWRALGGEDGRLPIAGRARHIIAGQLDLDVQTFEWATGDRQALGRLALESARLGEAQIVSPTVMGQEGDVLLFVSDVNAVDELRHRLDQGPEH